MKKTNKEFLQPTWVSSKNNNLTPEQAIQDLQKVFEERCGIYFTDRLKDEITTAMKNWHNRVFKLKKPIFDKKERLRLIQLKSYKGSEQIFVRDCNLLVKTHAFNIDTSNSSVDDLILLIQDRLGTPDEISLGWSYFGENNYLQKGFTLSHYGIKPESTIIMNGKFRKWNQFFE